MSKHDSSSLRGRVTIYNLLLTVRTGREFTVNEGAESFAHLLFHRMGRESMVNKGTENLSTFSGPDAQKIEAFEPKAVQRGSPPITSTHSTIMTNHGFNSYDQTPIPAKYEASSPKFSPKGLFLHVNGMHTPPFVCTKSARYSVELHNRFL